MIPELNLKTRYDEIADINSYIHLLNDEEKAFMNSYVEEVICANFHHSGKKLHDFEDPKVRSEIYLLNNSRNRDVYSRETAQGKLAYIAELEEQDESDTKLEEFNGHNYEG